MSTTLKTNDGRTIYPYNYAMLSFVAPFDGEQRDGFAFVDVRDVDRVALDLRNRGAVVTVGRTEAIERDDEAGFPAFRGYLNALEHCDTARRIGPHVVVLRAR